jgi:hypothetical protein
MEDFFEFLSREGFCPARLHKTIASGNKTKLLDFVQEVEYTLPYVRQRTSSRFGFLANTSLSGGPYPCHDAGCRLAKADELARFAALYADEILIRDPFGNYGSEWSLDMLQENLAGDLAVLWSLSPLLNEGVLGVAASRFAYCADHAAEAKDHNGEVSRKLYDAAFDLEQEYLSALTFEYHGETQLMEVRGPDHLVPHGCFFVGPMSPKVLTKAGRVRKSARRKVFYKSVIGSTLDDIIMQDLYGHDYRYNYLTDRALDARLISALSGDEVTSLSEALMRGLNHSVPVIESASIEGLLRLRKEEEPAFRVYRDAVTQVLRDADLTTLSKVEEAFSDAIQPELNKIDLAVHNSRRLLTRGMKRDVVVSAGVVSVGLGLGFIQPAIGAVLAALGGGKLVTDLGKAGYDALRPEPASIRENGFFFLWKLKRTLSQPSLITRAKN